MMLDLAAPRLLPVTIATLAALLAVKMVDLGRDLADARHGTTSAVVTQAHAAAKDASSPTRAAAAAQDTASGNTTAAGTGPTGKPPVAAGAASAVIASTATPGGASPAQAVAVPAAPSGAPVSSISDSERAILLDLRQRRQQLDARDAALSARESILSAAEQKLAAQTQALAALQTKLQDLQAARQQREAASWQGLVKLYENMKPRDAATIFNDLEMPVLLSLVDRMKELKAAPILAAMNPDKAREVTAGLARLRTRRAAGGATPAPGG